MDSFTSIVKAFDVMMTARLQVGVLEHCTARRSRSAAVICAYLMHREGPVCEATQDLHDTH